MGLRKKEFVRIPDWRAGFGDLLWNVRFLSIKNSEIPTMYFQSETLSLNSRNYSKPWPPFTDMSGKARWSCQLLLAIFSSAPCYIFICYLLYFPLLLAISSSAPCYIFFCSLLYLPLLLAISSSAPCYIFICRCWEGTLNGYLSQGDESTFRLNFRASSQTSVIISFKSSLNMVSYHPTIADQLSVFFLHFPLQSSYATYVW